LITANSPSVSSSLLFINSTIKAGTNGTIIITADEMDLGASASVDVSGASGTVILRPFSDDGAVNINRANQSSLKTLDLVNTELSKISANVRNVIIGRDTGTGLITVVNAVTSGNGIGDYNLTIVSGGVNGSIAINNTINQTN